MFKSKYSLIILKYMFFHVDLRVFRCIHFFEDILSIIKMFFAIQVYNSDFVHCIASDLTETMVTKVHGKGYSKNSGRPTINLYKMA